MSRNTRPEPPPEAVLIKRALKHQRMSGRSAAQATGISDARWRQIVTGFQTVAGVQHAVKAPPDTLARMALVVGVTPAQLREAGREDAAAELVELQEAGHVVMTPRVATPTLDAITALLHTLTPEEQEEVIRRIAGRPAPPAVQAVQPTEQEEDIRDRHAS
ncbi:hypothetical protein SUDANB1_05577 [Streptomyces sp. enrichment culture]|uniref:hypothetical protein n=1 Tax=Streptomyces sp. enrichment culture TaxID=1795815 RepID=UPI003F5550DD